jgi:hypothetical protein
MSTGTLLVLALTWAGGYLIVCWAFPYTAHRHCAGTGKHRSPGGRAWRSCRGCGGTGRRIRIGRQLLGALNDRRRP